MSEINVLAVLAAAAHYATGSVSDCAKFGLVTSDQPAIASAMALAERATP